MRYEATRYILVGLSSNILLYFLYLGITYIGVGHKTAMTALFFVGVVQTFYFNRRWTFASDILVRIAFREYFLIYSGAWLANFFALMVLVDQHRFAHELVQGVAVIVLAIVLFLLQKFWVFRDRPEQLIGNVSASSAGRSS